MAVYGMPLPVLLLTYKCLQVFKAEYAMTRHCLVSRCCIISARVEYAFWHGDQQSKLETWKI
jgi:hypothetical protein